MAVNGLASVGAIATDFSAGNFNVNVNFAFHRRRDRLRAEPLCQIPFTASKIHAEQIIRQILAAAAFSTYSVIIDPLDIKLTFQLVFT